MVALKRMLRNKCLCEPSQKNLVCISAISVIEMIVEAKRLRGKTLDVWVVFEVKTEIEFQNGKSANNSIVLQAHELTDVVYVR